MKKFLTLLGKVFLGEAILSTTLLICLLEIKGQERDKDSYTHNEIIGKITDGKIIIEESIDLGDIGYGRSGYATIKLEVIDNGCGVDEILTECNCTSVSTDLHRQYNRGDTIKISVEMRSVEHGTQLRRVHIIPINSSIYKAKSITLIANVK